MKPHNALAGHTPSWAMRFTLGAMLACMLLSAFFNVLVAWHLHTMTAKSDLTEHHADAVHGVARGPEAPVALGDIVERLCEAIKHCPCAIVWAGEQAPASISPLETDGFGQDKAIAFQSHHVDVPQRPPNGVAAGGGAGQKRPLPWRC